MTFSLMSWDKIGVGNAVCAHIDFIYMYPVTFVLSYSPYSLNLQADFEYCDLHVLFLTEKHVLTLFDLK